VIAQVLGPGVQHGEDCGAGAEVRRRRHEQRLGCAGASQCAGAGNRTQGRGSVKVTRSQRHGRGARGAHPRRVCS
jgi:hypothetical protein